MITPNYLRIAANDAHGINPPTPEMRTPVMPYVNRPFYENEFNRPTKYAFLSACARCGFYVYDAHTSVTDTPLPDRVDEVNAMRPSAFVTFCYNSSSPRSRVFDKTGGSLSSYSSLSTSVCLSQRMAARLSASTAQLGVTKNLGYADRDDAILSSVNAPSACLSAGFMTNFTEAKLMIDPEWQTMVAEAAAIGVCRCLDVSYNPASRGTDFPMMRNGSTGNYVYYLQSALLFQGYQNVPIDGQFGGLTDRAVRRLQQDNGLASDGVVGVDTWACINPDYSCAPTLRIGSTGVYVRYLKAKLLSKLYPIGTIDNVFDATAMTAVRTFQSENSLPANGTVDADTWQLATAFSGGRSLDDRAQDS